MRLRLAAATFLLPLSLACGTGGSGGVTGLTAFEIVRQSPDKTAEAGTARMVMTMNGGGLTMTMEGVSALNEVKAAMTTNMEIAGQRISMEIRMLDNVVYLKLPNSPGGKPWLSLDLEQLGDLSNVDIAALQQMRQNDPKQALAYIEGVSDDVKEDGKENLRGESTTRYRATFDLAKARDAQDDADTKAAIAKIIERLGSSTMPATVWIDGEGRMRKMAYDIDLSKVQGSGGAAGTMTTAFEMYDFGVALDVEPPPAAETGDGSILLQQQQQ